MKIFIGSDHQGYDMKQKLCDYLSQIGYEVFDKGNAELNPNDDFPQFASVVVNSLLTEGDKTARGILLCGSGQGMCMAANRFKGIRACLGFNQESARACRNDEDSNILCLPSAHIDETLAQSITDTWLRTEFSAAPRYIRRNQELDQLT